MKTVGVEPNADSIKRWCDALALPNAASLTRDWDNFTLQMSKLETFKEMVLQMTAASKRQEAERLKKKAEAAAKEAREAEAEAEEE